MTIKFYEHPDGFTLYVAKHNERTPRTVWINGEQVSLPLSGATVLPVVETCQTRTMSRVNQRYENEAGEVMDYDTYHKQMGQHIDSDGGWLNLEHEFAGRKLQQEWTFVYDTEEEFDDVPFEIIVLPEATNEYMMPLRHTMTFQMHCFDLNRIGYAKQRAKELCEREGLSWGDKGAGTYTWSSHSGLRYWEIEGVSVGTDDMKFDRRFVGTLAECEKELARIDAMIKNAVNLWRNRHKTVKNPKDYADKLHRILSTLHEVEPYQRHRDAYNRVTRGMRAVIAELMAEATAD